jgi:hypothetical protein
MVVTAVADGVPLPPKWIKWDDVKWKRENRTKLEKGEAIFFFFGLLNAKMAYE